MGVFRLFACGNRIQTFLQRGHSMSYYLKKFWRINLLTSLLLVAEGCLKTAGNLLSMQVFLAIIELDMRAFLFWTALEVANFLAICALRCGWKYCKARAIRSMNNEVRRDMVATLLQKSYRDFHAQDVGEYLSQFTNDIHQIESLAWAPFFDYIIYATLVVSGIVALTSLHWSLLAASLLSAAVMILLPKLFSRRMKQLGDDCAREQAQATSQMKDLLYGYDILCFFGRVKRLIRKAEEASDQIERPKFRLSYIKGLVNGIMEAASVLLQAALGILIGVLSIRGTIIQSAMLGGGNLCAYVSNGMEALASLHLSFSAARPYFDKITVHAGGPAAPAPRVEPIRESISVENVSFRYDEKPVLTDLTLRFQVGGKYALTGPSGCGKSTLLKLLMGWLPSYTGAIRIDGRDAREFTPEQLQQQISYIEQDVFLFNTTVRENITLGGEFTEEQLQKALQGSALADDLSGLEQGLDTAAGEGGCNLSGGQKQRVAIARALIHGRSVLLVDEGTSALDQKNADLVERSLLSNPGLTLILVSHHLSPERKAQFDRVYEL